MKIKAARFYNRALEPWTLMGKLQRNVNLYVKIKEYSSRSSWMGREKHNWIKNKWLTRTDGRCKLYTVVHIFIKDTIKLLKLTFQKIKHSKDKQRELENEQVRTLDKLNNARTNRIEEVPSLQVRNGFSNFLLNPQAQTEAPSILMSKLFSPHSGN